MNNPLHAQRGDEVFDVVNDRDEVLKQATRREVHALKLWHRAVHVLVFGSDARVFLQKRSPLKDTAPGRWDSACSGHVDAGETYLQAAVRELGEEIGLILPGPDLLTPLFRLSPCVETGWEFVWVYQVSSDGPFVLHPAEIERGDWLTQEALTRALEESPRDYTSALRCLWPKYLAGERS